MRLRTAAQQCELRAGVPGLQIPAPPQDERRKVMENVDQDRRHAIDAAIVRTMKSRKVLQHQQVCNGLSQCHSLLYRGTPRPSRHTPLAPQRGLDVC